MTQVNHIVLLAKSAIAAQPVAEFDRLAGQVAARTGVATSFAFTEQGPPSMRARLNELARLGARDITLVPLMLPMEPGTKTWLARAVNAWRAKAAAAHVVVRIAPAPDGNDLRDLTCALARRGLASAPAADGADKALGSVVPQHKRRVLVCQGGPCNEAGAALIWGHLRNEQARLGLKETASMMSAKTSCLGPCNLGPVVQVYPEGVYYGGVDEQGIDRIIAEHLIGGEIVPDLAYPANPGKQHLRRT